MSPESQATAGWGERTAAAWLQRAQLVLWAGLAVNAALLVLQVLAYPDVLAQTGAWGYVLTPVALLAAYAGVAGLLMRRGDSPRARGLQVGTALGMLAGSLWVVDLTDETFAPATGMLLSAPLLVGGFVLWGLAGFLAARGSASLWPGLAAGIWAAMVTALLTVTLGFLLGLLAEPQLQQLLVTDPDYLRSGWSDLHAFTIANTLDAAASHLGGALLLGTGLGAVGAVVGGLVRGRAPAPEEPPLA